MIPALIGAGASIIGGIMANNASAKSAQRQMDFQAQQSATAHQREVADLRAAGLNPILSSKYGGASTPPGASYQAQDVVTPGVNSAVASHRVAAEVKQMENAQKELLQSQAEQARSQSQLNATQAQKVEAETELTRAEIPHTGAKTTTLNLGYPNIPQQGNLMQAQAQAARAAGLRDISQETLNILNMKLVPEQIKLTKAQVAQIGQLLERGLSDVETNRILAHWLKTDPGAAATITKHLKDAISPFK